MANKSPDRIYLLVKPGELARTFQVSDNEADGVTIWTQDPRIVWKASRVVVSAEESREVWAQLVAQGFERAKRLDLSRCPYELRVGIRRGAVTFVSPEEERHGE